jgi:hypothetical protein
MIFPHQTPIFDEPSHIFVNITYSSEYFFVQEFLLSEGLPCFCKGKNLQATLHERRRVPDVHNLLGLAKGYGVWRNQLSWSVWKLGKVPFGERENRSLPWTGHGFISIPHDDQLISCSGDNAIKDYVILGLVESKRQSFGYVVCSKS